MKLQLPSFSEQTIEVTTQNYNILLSGWGGGKGVLNAPNSSAPYQTGENLFSFAQVLSKFKTSDQLFMSKAMKSGVNFKSYSHKVNMTKVHKLYDMGDGSLYILLILTKWRVRLDLFMK